MNAEIRDPIFFEEAAWIEFNRSLKETFQKMKRLGLIDTSNDTKFREFGPFRPIPITKENTMKKTATKKTAKKAAPKSKAKK